MEEVHLKLNSWRGHHGWEAYFTASGEEMDDENKGRRKVVSKFAEYFCTARGSKFITSGMISNTSKFLVDFSLILRDAPVKGLQTALKEAPEEALACIGLGAARAIEKLQEGNRLGVSFAKLPPPSPASILIPRVINYSPLSPLKSLKSKSGGQFFAVQGSVVRASSVVQQCIGMIFKCSRCLAETYKQFEDYLFSNPTNCSTEGCKCRTFQPLENSAKLVDWQRVQVQEILTEEEQANIEAGRVPRTVCVELINDLVHSCAPGDVITVCGIVKLLNIDAEGMSRRKESLYDLYIEANSVVNHRTGSALDALLGRRKLALDVCLTLQETKRFQEIQSSPDPFALLVHSLCPMIYGHDMVKAGLVLSLFGGSPRCNTRDHESVPVRSNVHCLVIGDPGLGKSQMLRATVNLTPRGVFISGNASTTAGLTVTVSRDAATGDFSFDAGALVMADESVCCIDEFDKMTADYSSLLEAMEQQTVSVAKAGILTNLPARTTVIAAANPVGGHYNLDKTVSENLKMPIPLLSRFDLAFVMLDKPNEKRDHLISAHVAARFGDLHQTQIVINSNHNKRRKIEANLKDRLASCHIESGELVDPSVLRGYIAYARKNFVPTLSDDAKEVIKAYYLALRKGVKQASPDSLPITTRQLESMIRLAQARAKCELRTVVTAEDARDVIDIMEQSMKDVFQDGHGHVDFSRSSGMSKSKEAKLFLKALHMESQRECKKRFHVSELTDIAKRYKIPALHFQEMLSKLNEQGFLLKQGTSTYKVV